jgi:hypothetical protein
MITLRASLALRATLAAPCNALHRHGLVRFRYLSNLSRASHVL